MSNIPNIMFEIKLYSLNITVMHYIKLNNDLTMKCFFLKLKFLK